MPQRSPSVKGSAHPQPDVAFYSRCVSLGNETSGTAIDLRTEIFYSGFMKLRILPLVLLFFLAGCGIPFNRPAVGPDGVIAFFLDKSGVYNFLPEGGTLTLIKGDGILQIPGVKAEGNCGAISWSRDGKELVFVDTELDDWWLPAAWNIEVTGVQTDSEAVTLVSSESPIIGPAFTPEGNVTYIEVDDDGNGHLFLYDRVEEVIYPLLGNVLSYRPTKFGSALWVIKKSDEGSLSLGHLIQYDPETGDEDEIASFFLGSDMEETLLLFPASFLWDIDPSGECIALTLLDQALITPELDDSDTSLYLINADGDTATRISTRGIAPAFSPDGAFIAYIGSENGEDQDTFLYDRSAQMEKRIPVTGSTAGLFWIDAGHLGLVMEKQAEASSQVGTEQSDVSAEETEDGYYLLCFNLETGEVSPLIPE